MAIAIAAEELGTDAVRDLIERASERARQLPDRSVRDPWPSSHRVISDSIDTGSRDADE
jgi:hypothetical protein